MTQFTDKYIHSHVKRQKAIEFQQLKQRNMTVLEYVTKFKRLARYAPELVDTVQKKVTKFLEGLNPIIERDATGVVPPATFDKAVKRAYKFETLKTRSSKKESSSTSRIKGNNRARSQGKMRIFQGKEHVDIVGRIMRLVIVVRP